MDPETEGESFTTNPSTHGALILKWEGGGLIDILVQNPRLGSRMMIHMGGVGRHEKNLMIYGVQV